MKHTSLYDMHKALNAKMTEFAGWEMPLYYSGILHEVNVVRKSSGIFDLSHMGEIIISGNQALELLQYITTNDISKLQVGDAQYTLFCDYNGGILEDLVVYRIEFNQYMLVVNAVNTESDLEWISSHNDFNVDISNQTMNTCLIALQGPASIELMKSLTDIEIPSCTFKIFKGRVGDVNCSIATTGYTGEDGYEIYCSRKDAIRLWITLQKNGDAYGVEPVGLGARDILRLEAGYALYGNDITRAYNPVNTRLIWVVKLYKSNFIGKSAIIESETKVPKCVLVGLESSERCVPRHDYELVLDDNIVGHVTSGTFSPILKKGIALAYVDTEYSQTGTPLCLQIRGRRCDCKIVNMPFYKAERVMQKCSSAMQQEVQVEPG